jgi:hypothetical protein
MVEMDKYKDIFTEKGITGSQLITMDSSKFKVSFNFTVGD